MTIERRHSLLKHDHEGDDIGPALLVTSSMFKGLGATNALPALGSHNASTSLSLRYATDPTYGLAAGVLGSGVSWIQSMRADGTATAYDLQLQPLGGGVSLAASYLVGRVISSNWNEGAISSDNALTFARASLGLTNQPASIDNANGQITYNYHSGGYARQFGFVDADEGFYTRVQQAGTWLAWRKVVTLSSTGLLYFTSGPSWCTAGWQRALQSINAIQLGSGSGSTGIGNSGSNFYIWHASGDTATDTATYLLYGGTTQITCNVGDFNAYNVRLVSGYALYLDGPSAGARYLTNNTGTYGTVSVGGSSGSFAGIKFLASYQARQLMFSTSGNQWGVYSESAGVWDFYHNSGFMHCTSGLYKMPYCTWSSNADGKSFVFSRGTAAPSGGTDGDVYLQYV